LRANALRKQTYLELLLGWLWSVVWNLLKSRVGWSKDGVVCLGAVQSLDEVWVVIKKLSELGGVL